MSGLVPEYPFIINGKEVTCSAKERTDVINPATEEIIGRVGVATPDEVNLAVESSHRAYLKWKKIPAVERAGKVMQFVNILRRDVDEIALALSREVGKPLPQAKGEVNGFCGLLEFYAQEARRISGSTLQSDQADRFVYVLKQPVGVVVAITPWNDPLALLGRMMGPAFAAGCSIIVKPASNTPVATYMVAKKAIEAGLPEGLFNVINGSGSKVGTQLVTHPLVRKIALTGGTDAGKQVMRNAADGMKRLTLELGGHCPCIVWKDADLEKAVEAITFQAFRSAGQVCNRVNRLYLHQDVYDEVVERISNFAAKVVVGNGVDAGVDIGPLNNLRQLEWVENQVKDALAKGATLHTGGSRIESKGFFFQPTLLGNCTPSMDVMKEETFGPVLACVPVGDNLEEAFNAANDTPYGLSAYFFSGDARNCFLAARELEAGSIWINDIHGSMLQAPYGGMKESGIGREQGSMAVEEYMEQKTIYQEMSYESRGARLCVHKQ